MYVPEIQFWYTKAWGSQEDIFLLSYTNFFQNTQTRQKIDIPSKDLKKDSPAPNIADCPPG